MLHPAICKISQQWIKECKLECMWVQAHSSAKALQIIQKFGVFSVLFLSILYTAICELFHFRVANFLSNLLICVFQSKIINYNRRCTRHSTSHCSLRCARRWFSHTLCPYCDVDFNYLRHYIHYHFFGKNEIGRQIAKKRHIAKKSTIQMRIPLGIISM